MYKVEHRVGRLYEARVFGLNTPADVEAYLEEFTPEFFDGVSSPVLIADHRPVVIYAPKIADMIVELFKAMNARWERVAILAAPTNATLSMQMQRLVRASDNPQRRVFFDVGQAFAFLSEVLSSEEVERLMAFLDEPVANVGVPIRSNR